MLLLIDNYDSFTYNLVQAFGALGATPEVRRNDAVSVEEIRGMAPRRIVISPGPGRPGDAGVSRAVVEAFLGELPLLGVCLGHQCIAEVLGGRVREARRLVHGKTSPIRHDGRGLFRGLPDPFPAARYHSLSVDEADLPATLEPCAWAEDGELMAIRHRELPVTGVQFHPESFLTPAGSRLLENFLEDETA